MKKRIYIALIALMLVVSMALVSCDLSSFDISLNDALGEANTKAEGETGDDDGGIEEEILELLEDKTPFEVYSSFNTKLEATADNCTVTTSSVVNTTMTVLGQNVDAVTDISLLTKTNGNNMYAKTTSVTVASGVNAENVTEIWYVDGVLYKNDGSQKVKVAVTEEQARELVYGDAASESTVMDIPESWFEGVCFEKQADGNFIMKINMSGDRMEEAIDRLGLAAEVGLEISDIKYEYKLDKYGMILGCEAKYTMEMDDNSGSSLYSGSAEGTMSTVYSDMGNTEEITAPADADSYIEVAFEDIKASTGK